MHTKKFLASVSTLYFLKNKVLTMRSYFTRIAFICASFFSLCAEEIKIYSQIDWQNFKSSSQTLVIKNGMVEPSDKEGFFRSKVHKFSNLKNLKEISFEQSPVWQNWEPVENLGPANLGDAPVFLSIGPNDHWIFGLYRGMKRKSDKNSASKKPAFVAEEITLQGYDELLLSTKFPNQYNAPSGTVKSLGGYHAWHSRDMKTWVHYGPITERFSRWMTTAEYVDGKFYFYYDFPNDQDPHLYIDTDIKDGKPGKNMGLAFKDPSDGSDCTFFRDKDGKFHVIYENWSPIDANMRSWDSPLAGHAISDTGFSNFKILPPAIGNRTKPKEQFAEYSHPHWHKEDPKNYPGRLITETKGKDKKGDVKAFARYQIHEPRQEAYGDWASIKVGDQYYLFGDFDPADSHTMSTVWFTSDSLDKPFSKCDHIGEGHPDPAVGFADGKFYLITQPQVDFTSPGPWVESVVARLGVDSIGDGKIDTWTNWTDVTEKYSYTPSFVKHVTKTPAKIDLSNLPKAHAFQFEFKVTDTTENKSKPIIDKIIITY